MLWNWLVYATVFRFTPVVPASTVQPSPDLVPCERGWFHFREKCYKVGDSAYLYSWKESADRCAALGGSLVTIESQEENDFIVTFLLLDIKKTVWIGLNDQQVESQYTWLDGSRSKYRNWRPHEPNPVHSLHEDCVEMNFEPEWDSTGQWSDLECEHHHAYLCQKKAKRRKISPDPRFCSSDVGGGWKYQDSCYHVIEEKSTWHSAEQYCKRNFNGGHLVTVLDFTVDKFLNYIVSDLDEELWIGINIKDQFQQQWSSGWYVGYSGLLDDIRSFEEGDCVARNTFQEWSVVDCYKELFFICETSNIKPPVLPKPAPGYHCPEGIEGLRDVGGDYCYYIDLKNYFNRFRASYECERKGGSLASIHSKEENDILGSLVRYTLNYRPSLHSGVYIGLLRSLTEGEEFIWSDVTPMDYKNWNPYEPNYLLEKCGTINHITMGWSDVPCEEKKGYICSIRKIGPSSPVLGKIVTKNTSITTFAGSNIDCSQFYDVMVRCLSNSE